VPVLLKELEATTSVAAKPGRAEVRADSRELFSYPFLYMTGTGKFEPFSDDEILNLRKYLKMGGTLVGDDSAAAPGYGFDLSFREQVGRIFPDQEMMRLHSDHTVFRSFFLIRGIGGRSIVSPFLEGVDFQGRTPVIYSPNGIGSALAKDRYGRWRYPVEPGGARQRRLAHQLGVNLILYALCSDYKQDRVHLPFLRRKI
jgi:hypothetical protein